MNDDASDIFARLSPAEILHWIEKGWDVPASLAARWERIAKQEVSRREELSLAKWEKRRAEVAYWNAKYLLWKQQEEARLKRGERRRRPSRKAGAR